MHYLYRPRQLALLAILVLSAAVAPGCASVQEAKDARGTGVKRIYDKPVSDVWNAMHTAVQDSGGEIKEEDEGACSILVEYGPSAFSWGERVGLFCSSITPAQTETEIVSRRAIKMNAFAKNWTSDLYKRMDASLK